MESFAEDEVEDDISMVLLSEATWEQLYEELYDRFSSFIFAGVPRYPFEREDEAGTFITSTEGDYIAKRGLYAVLGEWMEMETEKVKDGVFLAEMFDDEDDEEDDDDTSFMS